MLVRHLAVVPDPGQQFGQPRHAVRRRPLDVDQPGQPGRQLVLILQPGDPFTRRDPAVALPVDPHEHLALRQVGPVHRSRRMRPGPQLEHHRHQPQGGHRVPHCLPLGGQLAQRRTHEHPHPLIRRADHIRLGHHPQATVQQRRRDDHPRRAATPGHGAVSRTNRKARRTRTGGHPVSRTITSSRPAGNRDLWRPWQGARGCIGHAIRPAPPSPAPPLRMAQAWPAHISD